MGRASSPPAATVCLRTAAAAAPRSEPRPRSGSLFAVQTAALSQLRLTPTVTMSLTPHRAPLSLLLQEKGGGIFSGMFKKGPKASDAAAPTDGVKLQKMKRTHQCGSVIMTINQFILCFRASSPSLTVCPAAQRTCVRR